MVTVAVKLFLKKDDGWEMIGSSKRSTAKLLLVLEEPGVGLAVKLQSLPPSVVRAYETREMASG